MSKAVVLLSGGIDSSTVLAIARAEGHELYALSFDYGQRHSTELESAKSVAAALGVKKHLITSFDMRNIGGSALTDDIAVPKDSSSALPDFRASELIPVTYVPARNTIFLSFALAWAEVLQAADIYIGANAVDYSGYPDCRPEYLESFENMANLATRESVEGRLRYRIRAPLLRLTKAEIIRKGLELGLDYGLTWSCYDPQGTSAEAADQTDLSLENLQASELTHLHAFKACGRCDSCLFRLKGFSEAGSHDPLDYADQK